MATSTLALLALLLIIGVGTFLLRLSFLELMDRLPIPPLLRDALRFVPPAVLAALVVPALVHGGDPGEATPRLIAGTLAALVAIWRRSVITTLLVGMGALWLLTWLLDGTP